MKADAAYFHCLANSSELSLLQEVTRLAEQRNLQALHGFVDFVETLPKPVTLSILAGDGGGDRKCATPGNLSRVLVEVLVSDVSILRNNSF